MIDKELQRYYEARFDMMAQPGWKDLMEDLQKMTDQYSDIRNTSGSFNIEFRKGQVDILDYLLNLKQLSERAWEELNEKDI
jgi:hypothetical protein